MRQVERAAVGEVEQAAGGADDDVDAGLEGVELAFVRDSAVDREVAGAALGRGDVDVAGDLDRELAGGRDDEGLRLARGSQLVVVGIVRSDGALDDGDAEGKRLASARTGLADEVGADEGYRKGHFLDREGVFNADIQKRVGDFGHDAQFSKGGQGTSLILRFMELL